MGNSKPAQVVRTEPSPPNSLVDAFKDDRAAVFVGAGASIAAGLPSWDVVVRLLAKRLDGLRVPRGPVPLDLLLKIPQYYVNHSAHSRRELVELLEKEFEKGRNAFRREKPKLTRPVHYYLAQLPTNRFYTTNIDLLLEEELADQRAEYQVIHDENSGRIAKFVRRFR